MLVMSLLTFFFAGGKAHDYWYDDLAKKWNGVEDTPLGKSEMFVCWIILYIGIIIMDNELLLL